ncbi:hypothetical protein MMC18_002045 [Xylographa bjoerkii]|nr:hypothetical protein [Xylographa bjoerkii]
MAVSLMLWARRLCNTNLEADDYILIVAYVITVILVGQITWAIIDGGQGRHVADVPRTQLALVASSLLANETLWSLVNTLIRISVLLFISRVFSPIRLLRIWSYSLIVLSVLYGMVSVLEIFLICRPLAAAWDNNINGECGQEVLSYVVLETFGLMLDLIILVLPLRPIWRLHLPLGRKVGLSCIFSIGGLVVIITALRIKALHMVTSADFTYARGYLGLLSVLGALLSIIACCAPCVAALLTRVKRPAFLNTLYGCRFFRALESSFQSSAAKTQEQGLPSAMLGRTSDVESGSSAQQDDFLYMKDSRSAVIEDTTVAADKIAGNPTIATYLSRSVQSVDNWLAVAEFKYDEEAKVLS